MEQIIATDNHIPQELVDSALPLSIEGVLQPSSTAKPFIEANTIPCTLDDIRNNHIIPVFIKDNETLISQVEFIEVTMDCIISAYPSDRILAPSIRLSHPIKGRVPSARDKAANNLEEHEKTLYYERMAFVIEIPTIGSEIDGNHMGLTIGGVKAYNQDNLYGRKGNDEHFKVFIGFQNKVCTNLCVWSDGFVGDLTVRTQGQLKACIRSLIESYNAVHQLHHLQQLPNYCLSEHQFATLIGRCRMFPHIPKSIQQDISPLRFGDAQINTVVNDYYKDQSFCKMESGEINLWRLYNLLTNANKSTYIDSFLERSVSAYKLVEQIKSSLQHQTFNWYLS
jgi:hypothetical protein